MKKRKIHKLNNKCRSIFLSIFYSGSLSGSKNQSCSYSGSWKWVTSSGHKNNYISVSHHIINYSRSFSGDQSL